MTKHFKKKYLFVLIPVLLIALFVLRPGSGASDQMISLQQIAKGDVELTVSSSGQVKSNQSVDLNPQGNGPVEAIFVSEGDTVVRGQLLLSLNATDEGVNLRNAELDLESAQIKLNDLKEPSNESSQKKAENDLLKAQNDLAQRKTSYDLDIADKEDEIADLEDDLPDAYQDAFNTVAEIFVDLPSALQDLEDIMEANNYSGNQNDLSYYSNYLDTSEVETEEERVKEAYSYAQSAYNTAVEAYQNTTRSETEKLSELTSTSYEAVDKLSTALKEMDVFLALVAEDFPSNHPGYALDEQRDTVSTNIGIINPHLSSIYDDLNTIEDLNDSILDAQNDLERLSTDYNSDISELELTIEEKQIALDDVTDSADDSDIRSQEIEVEKKQNNLVSAQKAYNDMFIYAPFGGVITSVGVDLGQSVSGSSPAFTMISEEKLIEVNLNEIDVSKVRVGQTGVASFDSFGDASVPVELVFVSDMNESDSSVVEYKAHFSLAATDLELKEGMSAEVTLTLDKKEDVLVIPRLALLVEDGQNYVEVVEALGSGYEERTLYPRSTFTTKKVPVTLGLEGTETVEIVSGLNEGDWVFLQSDVPVEEPNANQFAPEGGGPRKIDGDPTT